MKKTLPLALGAVLTLSLTSCDYENSYHEGQQSSYSGKSKQTSYYARSTGRPMAKAPAQLGLVRIEKTYKNKLYITKGAQYEQETDSQTLSQLKGVRSVLMLNSLMGGQTFDSMSALRKEARRYGVNVIGAYTFDTNTVHKDYASILSIATLGLSPTQGIKTTSMATFSIIDAHSGYLYGASSTLANEKSIATGWGYHNAEKEDIAQTEEKAYQAMLKKIPGAWNRAL